MHAVSPDCFLEHRALGMRKSPVRTLNCWTIYYICYSVAFFLVSDRSGRNRLKRLVYHSKIHPMIKKAKLSR